MACGNAHGMKVPDQRGPGALSAIADPTQGRGRTNPSRGGDG
jgi:hypothetical protein